MGMELSTGVRRAALWLFDTPSGLFVFAVAGAALFLAPGYFLGAYWIVGTTSLFVGWIAGWAMARRYWRKNGYVPKV